MLPRAPLVPGLTTAVSLLIFVALVTLQGGLSPFSFILAVPAAYFLVRELAAGGGAKFKQREHADVLLLISLRDALIHYKPEWIDHTEGPQELVASLASKFALNPLEPEALGEYLDRYLSYGCARWAVESSLDFADEFFRRMAIKGFYQDLHPPPRSLLP